MTMARSFNCMKGFWYYLWLHCALPSKFAILKMCTSNHKIHNFIAAENVILDPFCSWNLGKHIMNSWFATVGVCLKLVLRKNYRLRCLWNWGTLFFSWKRKNWTRRWLQYSIMISTKGIHYAICFQHAKVILCLMANKLSLGRSWKLPLLFRLPLISCKEWCRQQYMKALTFVAQVPYWEPAHCPSYVIGETSWWQCPVIL